MSRPQATTVARNATIGFNPVLGFLSVSTRSIRRRRGGINEFQSRAGFSECLDYGDDPLDLPEHVQFQSRAGFSECLDPRKPTVDTPVWFQSRAGFSECLDLLSRSIMKSSSSCFNPVLGFLSVSTAQQRNSTAPHSKFQSRAGFSECLDTTTAMLPTIGRSVSIPCWVF